MKTTKRILAIILTLVTLMSITMVGSSTVLAATNTASTTTSTTVCKTHKYDKGTVTKAATCTKTGTRTYKCTVCGTKKTEKIAKTSHNYQLVVNPKATTEKAGKTSSKACTMCGKSIKLSKTHTVAKIKSIKLSATKYNYNGKKHLPTVTVKDANGKKLKKNVDYTVKYSKSNPVKVGTYKVTIKFIGRYKGTTTLTYKITEKEHKYNYKADTKATLKTNGKATVKICEGCGKKVKLSKAASIAKVTTFTLSKTKLTYTGKAQKPSVTVKDSKGNKLVKDKDYTVTYSNSSSKKVGTYKVTIKLKGNYSGSKVLEYKIVKLATGTSAKITNVTAKNVTKSVDVYTMAKDWTLLNHKYVFMETRKVGQGIKVSWTPVKGVDGYEIQYSLNSKCSEGTTYAYTFKDAEGDKLTRNVRATYITSVSGADTSSVRIHGTIKATYYVRVRSFINKNGKYTYSAWSAIQSVNASYNCAVFEYPIFGTKINNIIYDEDHTNANHACKNYYEHYILADTELVSCTVCGSRYCKGRYVFDKTTNHFGAGCPEYSKKDAADAEKCSYCGRPIFGKGSCTRYITSGPCDYCGVNVKANTCHECKTGPMAK